jgi:hypothetical protein
MAFYWYNFMPLSRGTAATGYIALIAMFLAIGVKIDTLVPEEFLVDWQVGGSFCATHHQREF